MKKRYQKITRWVKNQAKAIAPGQHAIKGAALGILTITGFFWILFAFGVFKGLKDGWILLLFLLFVLAAVLSAYLTSWLLKGFSNLNKGYKLALLIALPLLFMMSFDWIIPLFILVLGSLSGAGILVLKKTGLKNLSKRKQLITLMGMLIGFGGFITAGILYSKTGFDVDPMVNAAKSVDANILPIDAPSPAAKGPYQIRTLTYGSGKDLHRPEYGVEVNIKTDSVNGVAFIDDWDGFGGWWREKYWGFDSSSLPLNARVWYPEGDGPFPLALIVHGNHSMQDYSDTGYEYLGELLASKGIILASVDENFINGSWSDIFGGLDKENDARGWLLLEHLRQFHEWNDTEGHQFYQKIDTANLALIGHSRGGEAVAHAAMFNKLPFYPDDASVKFDYNYGIKSVVAIAPVDGQYKAGETRTVIEDVNYFVIHGAQDADVASFMGSQQYERVRFKDSLYHFKSGLYVYGANHGQFNTSWGNNDTGNPFTGLLNLKQLLSSENQLNIAKVYIGSFLDITLKNKKEYLPLFTDSRKGANWLPETVYLSQFEDSNLQPIANFDEDFNVVTTTQKAGKITTKNLTVWREQEIKLKWQEKGSRALFIGWDYDFKNKKETMESVPDTLIASYSINVLPTAADSTAVLVFSMAESKEKTNPKSGGKWIKGIKNDDTKNEDSEKEDSEKEKEEEDDDEDEVDKEEPKAPIDFTIQLKDSLGQQISFPLSSFSPLQRTIEVMINKTGFLNDDKESEKIYQTFYFPFEELQKTNPRFRFAAIEKLIFVFDKNENGVISIDNIGFMKKP